MACAGNRTGGTGEGRAVVTGMRPALLAVLLVAIAPGVQAADSGRGWYVISPTQDPRTPPRRSAQRFLPLAALEPAPGDSCVAAVGQLQLQSLALAGEGGRTVNLLGAQVSPSLLSALASKPLDKAVLAGRTSLLLPQGVQRLGLKAGAVPASLTRSIAVQAVPGAPAGAPRQVQEPLAVSPADTAGVRWLAALPSVALLQASDPRRAAAPYAPPTVVVKLKQLTPQCTARVDALVAVLAGNPIGQAYTARASD